MWLKFSSFYLIIVYKIIIYQSLLYNNCNISKQRLNYMFFPIAVCFSFLMYGKNFDSIFFYLHIVSLAFCMPLIASTSKYSKLQIYAAEMSYAVYLIHYPIILFMKNSDIYFCKTIGLYFNSIQVVENVSIMLFFIVSCIISIIIFIPNLIFEKKRIKIV